MKKINFLLFIFLSGFFALEAQDRTKEISTEIREVTVYLYGATINRAGQADLEPGTTKLVLTGLSPKLDSRSIQVGLGTDVSILSVSDNPATIINQKKLPILKFLTDSIEAVKFQIENERNTSFVLDQELSLLMANKSLTGEKGVVVPELEDALLLYRKELPEIKRRLLTSSMKLRDLQTELDTLTNRYNVFKRNNEQFTREIHITVSVAARTKANIDLQYYVPEASWMPKYDVRTINITDPITFAYKAELRQNTGENWDGVKMVLSTNNPMYSGNLPQLFTNFIDLSNFYNTRQQETPQSYDYGYYKAQPQIVEGEMSFSANQALQGSVTSDLRFDVAYPVKLVSDNTPMVLEVKKATLPAAYKFFTVPKADCSAYLKAQVTGWEDINLLSGDANLYLEGTFLGKTYINSDQLDDTLSLYMGKDRRVVCKRTKMKEMSSKNFLGNKIKQSVVWEIEIRNNKKEAINIEVQDQIPVSKDEDLEVQKDDMGGAELDNETGLLTWNKTIQPGETIKIRFGFSLRYPKNSKVSTEKLRQLRRDNYM